MSEVWKDIPGWEGLYQASNGGRIRRVNGRVLVPQFNKRTGYLKVALSRSGKVKNGQVHILVAEAFLGPRPAGLDVCHRNGDRLDNRPSNFRFDTRKGNLADRVEHGTMNWGERCGAAKLSSDQVIEIVALTRSGRSMNSVGKVFGVTRNTVRSIMIGRNWSHLTGLGAGGGHL